MGEFTVPDVSRSVIRLLLRIGRIDDNETSGGIEQPFHVLIENVVFDEMIYDVK